MLRARLCSCLLVVMSALTACSASYRWIWEARSTTEATTKKPNIWVQSKWVGFLASISDDNSSPPPPRNPGSQKAPVYDVQQLFDTFYYDEVFRYQPLE